MDISNCTFSAVSLNTYLEGKMFLSPQNYEEKFLPINLHTIYMSTFSV